MSLNLNSILESEKSKKGSPPPVKPRKSMFRKSIPLKIEKISILNWLKHYKLEQFYESIFINKYKPNKYGIMIKSIKTNVDLLFSFPSIENFITIINTLINSKLFEDSEKGIISQHAYFDLVNENTLKFKESFTELWTKRPKYKELLSVLGLNSKESNYINLIDKSPMLNILDTPYYKERNIIKRDIIAKLHLLTFKDLIYSTPVSLRLYLSLPIELCNVFNLNTDSIKNGLNKDLSKTQFKKFIKSNDILDLFESCDNNFNRSEINKNLINNIDSNTLLNSQKMELLSYLIRPKELILEEVVTIIYNYVFPDNDTKFIDSQFNDIPKIIPFKKTFSKTRVFYISAHGDSCELNTYSKETRVNYERLKGDIQHQKSRKILPLIPTQSKKSIDSTTSSTVNTKMIKESSNITPNNLTIISNQSLGRLSYFEFLPLFNSLFSSHYRDIFLNGLFNSKDITHLNYLNSLVTLFLHKKNLKKIKQNLPQGLEKPPYLKDYNKKDHGYRYMETKLSTNDIVNFVKYNLKHPPLNSNYTFDLENTKSDHDLFGIFELNDINSLDLENLNNKITNIDTNDNELKLGLKLNEIYDFKGDIPKNIDNILKFNKKIYNGGKLIYTLEELIQIIYTNANIKSDEKVVIFSNSCRGVTDSRVVQKIYERSMSFFNHRHRGLSNTALKLSRVGKNDVLNLRLKSYEKLGSNSGNSVGDIGNSVGDSGNMVNKREGKGSKKKGRKGSKKKRKKSNKRKKK